ncbi:MAG: PKD domain-containing protein [Chitinophagaceae bacterium]
MSIWITSDRASSGTVTMTNGAFSAPFNIPANGLQEIQIPHATGHISNAESGIVIQKSIRIKTDPGKPAVVAYAQQWGAARSAATLLLPTNVLGRNYYATSFTQTGSNSGTYLAKSQFQIIATKPNTQVRITPRTNGTVGASFIISLPLIGDMYQYQADQDLTGSLIESIASPTGGCLPIAVFSGSSNLTFGTNSCVTGNSYDPLFQQQYPISTWGKNFGFIPFGDYPNGNPYRVLASEDNTNVYFNGSLVATLNAGQIYPATFNNTPVVLNAPTSITADKPVAVIQYASRQNCSGSGFGDPDMVLLNPIEQNISDITIFSSSQQAITRQWVNILIKTVAVPSFRISFNGGPLNPPTGTWQAFAPLPGYSYLQQLLGAAGSYRLVADSGYNAIAYGFSANFESYAYSAGTNVKDLYQQIGVATQYGIEPTPSVCKGSPFRFKVSLPYCADSILWDLTQLPGPPVPSNVLTQYSTCTPGVGGPDSTTVVNSVTLYWYSLPTLYTFNTSGTFPVNMTVYKPNTDGCGSEQEIDFDLNVYDPPIADFLIVNSGCVAEAVQFTDNTETPRPSYIWNWDFGDPASGAANTSTLQNPTHIFSGPGTYDVTFSTITTPGCISAQIVKQVVVVPIPTAAISGATTVCVNDPEPSITFTATDGTAPYTFSYHINAGPAIHLPSPTNTISIPVPTGVAGTYRYYLDSVKNTGSTLCVTPYTNTYVDVIVNQNTGLALAAGSNNQSVCQNIAIGNIDYAISGGGNNATASGLPAGVTGVYNAGTFTISGIPTTPGTYNYTVTATGLCLPNSLTGTITVNPDAAISLTSANNTQSLCINTPVTSISYSITGGGTGGTVSGLPPGVNGTYSGGVFTITGSPTATGTYNYTVNTTGTCLQASATGTITVNPDATLSLSSPAGTANQIVCENVAIIDITYAIGGGGTGGTVTGLPPGVTGTYSGGVFTITGTPTVTGTYNYTVNTTGTCLQTNASGTITVNPDAAISLTSAASTNAQELCINSAITNITYSISGGGTGGTVSGLPAGVTGSFSGGVFTITGTPTASGTFNYTVTTTGTCVQKTATGTVIVNALPVPDFNVTTPSCETKTLNFTDLSTPNSGVLTTWAWNFGDLNTSILQNPTHTYAAAGTYTVTLSVTTDKGCVSNPVLSRSVTVHPQPDPGFILPEVCLSDTYAQFNDTSDVASGSIASWLWDFGDPGSGAANTSTLQHPQHSYTAVGNYTVTLTVTTNNGCVATRASSFTVNGDIPVANFNALSPATMCANDSISIQDASTVNFGSVTKVEIYWDNVNFPGVFQTDDFPTPGEIYRHLYPNFQAPLTRSFDIRYRAYSGATCVNDRIKTIVVNAAPKVQFNNMPDICLDAVPYQIPPSIASEIGGVPGSGVFSGPGVTAGGLFNPALVGPGTYTIKYTFTSTAGGCVDTLSKTITVLDSASAQFTYSTLNCEGSPVSFNSITSTIPTASGTITGWTWDFGDPASGAANTSALQNPSHTFSGWGTYNVTLYVTTSNGCRSTIRSVPVFVNPLPRPDFSFPASSCLPSATVAFNSSASSIPDGTQSSFTYLWNFGDPGSGALNTSTSSSPSHIYNSVGPFTVTLQITSGAGCVNTKTIQVNTIHPEPTGRIIVDKNDVCVGQSFTFTDNSDPADGTATTWNWNMGDGNTRTSSSFNYTYTTAGSYTVSLFITNSHGCRSTTATRPVTVNPYPVVNAGPDLFILQDGSDTLHPVITNGINPTYLWTPNLYFLTSNTVMEPIVKGVEDITYTLTVTGRGDCKSSDQVFIKVLKGPEIPNIFSPNGDGVHDRWEIKYLDTYPGGTVEIFNRYGQMIFRSVGYAVPWDGTVNGQPVPIGTYYYIVNPKNGRKTMSGYVDVIR